MYEDLPCFLQGSKKREQLEFLLKQATLTKRNSFFDDMNNLEGIDIKFTSDLLGPGSSYSFIFEKFCKNEWKKLKEKGFPDYLIADHLLRRDFFEALPQEGELVVYGNFADPLNSESLHVGALVEGKVVSRFSSGHAFTHEIGCIPSSYGSHVRFYQLIE